MTQIESLEEIDIPLILSANPAKWSGSGKNITTYFGGSNRFKITIETEP